MRYSISLTILLLAVALGGGLWLDAGALVPLRETSAGLRIAPPTKIDVRLGTNSSLDLQGEGLSEGTRVWLVPETTQRMALTASFKTWGNPYQVHKNGSRVYLANGKQGVLALDLSDWARPRLLAGMELPGQALDLEIIGSKLFVACGSAGLQVVDFKDPLAPQLLSSLALPGAAMALQLQGDKLYIAGSKAGLIVVDVTSPEHPFLLTHTATPGPALDVTIAGACAFVACGLSGIAPFDITVPQRPQPLAIISPTGFVRSLVGNNNLLYVGSSDKSATTKRCLLSLYDCSIPNQARLLAEQPLAGDPQTLQLEPEQLIVAQGLTGVQIFDLATPEQPRLVDTINSIGSVQGAISEGDWLLVADATGFLHTARRSELLRLPVISTLASRISTPPLLQDGYMFLTLRNYSLQIYSTSDPVRPMWLADLPLPGQVAAMLLRDELLYLSVDLKYSDEDGPRSGRLLIVSLADVTHPQLLASLPLPAASRDLVLDGQRLVLAAPSRPFGTELSPPGTPRGNLLVIDVSVPQRPIIRHKLELELTPTGLAWQDGYAYLSLEEGRMQVLRVPAEQPPELVSELEFPWLRQGEATPQGGARGGGGRGAIKLVGTVAAVYTGASELSFVDIAVPSRPVLLGTCETPGFIEQLSVDENFLYVGINNKGIAVYDLHIPWQPRQTGLLPMPVTAKYFTLSDAGLWFASNAIIGVNCIPKPQAVAARSDAEGHRLALQLPQPRATGDYALWVERDNNLQEVPNSVRFSPR